MSSLRKLFKKNKSIKSLEKTLTKVLEQMHKTVTTTIVNPNLQSKAKELVQTFDEEFTTLSEAASTQAQVKHDATLFDTLCINVRNDLKSLDECIKELRKHINKF